MAESTFPLVGTFDRVTGVLKTIGIEGWPGTTFGPGTNFVTLSEDYTLKSTDDETVFIAAAPVIVTVPELATPPSCIFMPKASASITLHPGTINVLIDGANDDDVRSVVSDPNGFAFEPNYGTSNSYATTDSSVQFDSIIGDPADNVSLLATLEQYLVAPTVPTKISTNLTLDATTAGPGVNDHQRSFRVFNSLTVDKTVSINAGCRLDLQVDFARGPNGVGNLVFQAGAGVTVWTKLGIVTGAGGGVDIGRLVPGANSARLICTGTANQFFLLSSDLTA